VQYYKKFSPPPCPPPSRGRETLGGIAGYKILLKNISPYGEGCFHPASLLAGIQQPFFIKSIDILHGLCNKPLSKIK